jgi:hypothetical protein
MGFPETEVRMTIESVVRIFAGAVVLASLGLAVTLDLNWLWLTAFVGANLFQSGFTGLCPLASILRRTPWFRSSVRPA